MFELGKTLISQGLLAIAFVMLILAPTSATNQVSNGTSNLLTVPFNLHTFDQPELIKYDPLNGEKYETEGLVTMDAGPLAVAVWGIFAGWAGGNVLDEIERELQRAIRGIHNWQHRVELETWLVNTGHYSLVGKSACDKYTGRSIHKDCILDKMDYLIREFASASRDCDSRELELDNSSEINGSTLIIIPPYERNRETIDAEFEPTYSSSKVWECYFEYDNPEFEGEYSPVEFGGSPEEPIDESTIKDVLFEWDATDFGMD